MKRILITGSEGYIGKSIYSKFNKKYSITCVSRNNFDLTNSIELNNFFLNQKKFDVVIHCAVKGGNRLIKDDYSIMDTNLTMYYNLLQHQGKSYSKLIHFGSGAEVLLPDQPYGLSKNIIARSSYERKGCYNIRIYGLFDSKELDRRFIKANIKRYLNKEPIIIHQDKFMDFFYMKDLLNLIELYISSNKELPKEIECCYSRPFSLLDIADIINSLEDYKVEVKIKKTKFGEPYIGNPLKRDLINLIGLEMGIQEMYKEIKNN